MKHTDSARSDVLHHAAGETHLFREIMRIHQAVLGIFSRETGMTSSRFALLRILAIHHPVELGVREIAQRLAVDAAAVTRQVKELEAAGLVSRRADPRDGRRTRLRLSTKGKAAFRAIHERVLRFEETLSSRLAKEHLQITLIVLSDVRAMLEEMK